MLKLEPNRIETRRLVLRQPRDCDALRLAAIANSRRIAAMLGTMPHPYGIKDARDFLARRRFRWAEVTVFAVTSKEASGLLIGMCGYGPSEVDAGTDFGYWLGVDYWGRGYATEAARAILAHAFESGGIEVITTDHRISNFDSARVLAKLGFKPIGQRRRPSLGAGGHMDTVMLRLTREQWRQPAINVGVGRRSRTLACAGIGSSP